MKSITKHEGIVYWHLILYAAIALRSYWQFPPAFLTVVGVRSVVQSDPVQGPGSTRDGESARARWSWRTWGRVGMRPPAES